MSATRTRPGSEGMTLVELAFVLTVLGGLGWGGAFQLQKLRRQVKAIEVKVLIVELDRTFESHVAEHGLSLPTVEDDVTLETYPRVARVAAGEIPHIPNPESNTFDFLLSTTTDSWRLTVQEKGKGKEGFLMACGYQFTSSGAVEVNPESPWADYLRPTCVVADKTAHN